MINKQDEFKITEAIKTAEKQSSGEIMVHYETAWAGDPYQRAVHWFHKLEMHKTDQRNGVLIYLIEKQKRFAIVGDAGIHAKVKQEFWDSTSAIMSDHFKSGRLTEGLCTAIAHVGEALAQYFPYDDKVDRNELPDQVSHS